MSVLSCKPFIKFIHLQKSFGTHYNNIDKELSIKIHLRTTANDIRTQGRHRFNANTSGKGHCIDPSDFKVTIITTDKKYKTFLLR